MQKIRAYLVCATVALMAFGQAVAQSPTKFELASADGKYKLGFKGLLQENNRIDYTNGSKDTDFSMELNRARISLYGHALDPRLSFYVQTAWEKNNVDLSDYYLNLNFNDRYFNLRIGKFTTPFSREQLIGNTHTRFYNASAAADMYKLPAVHDVGLMIHNGHHNDFEYALALVSQGIVARIGFNQNGIDGYDYVDWNGGDLRFGIAASGYLHTDYKSTKINDARASADFIAKVGHFAVNGAFYYQYDKPIDEVAHNLGASVELGYLIKKVAEPALRYSWIKLAKINQHEILGGVNYYVYGHNFKVQTYAGPRLEDKDITSWVGGVQVQLAI